MSENVESTETLEEAVDNINKTAEEAEAAEGAESAAEAGASDLEAKVESLEAELSEAKDQSLRVAAEMQNLRKRAERDVENAHKFGQEKLINELLPVLDNLDRAIASVDQSEGEPAEEVKSILEGVELTRKSTLEALKKFSVEVVEPYGEPFDPNLHEAMTMVPSDTVEPNSVVDVLQKGYVLNGRLLRAAMVVVSKS